MKKSNLISIDTPTSVMCSGKFEFEQGQIYCGVLEERTDEKITNKEKKKRGRKKEQIDSLYHPERIENIYSIMANQTLDNGLTEFILIDGIKFEWNLEDCNNILCLDFMILTNFDAELEKKALKTLFKSHIFRELTKFKQILTPSKKRLKSVNIRPDIIAVYSINVPDGDADASNKKIWERVNYPSRIKTILGDDYVSGNKIGEINQIF